MKIALCSSARFAKEASKVKQKLEKKGFTVLLYPQIVEVNNSTMDVREYYAVRKKKLTAELLKTKRKLMDEHLRKIKSSDAILILNFDVPKTTGYVGGNTFLEMGAAYTLGKRVFIWKKPSKKLPYFEEITAINPINIRGDLSNIH